MRACVRCLRAWLSAGVAGVGRCMGAQSRLFAVRVCVLGAGLGVRMARELQPTAKSSSCARARVHAWLCSAVCRLQQQHKQQAERAGRELGDQLGVDSTEQNEGAERLRSHHTPTYARANRRKTQRR